MGICCLDWYQRPAAIRHSTVASVVFTVQSVIAGLTAKQGTMDAMDIQAVESKLNDVTVTAVPMGSSGKSVLKESHVSQPASISSVSASITPVQIKDRDSNGVSKYAQLLAVIEEMGKDVRPSYSGSRSSAERLKRGIIHARILVKECLIETERSARQ